MKMPDRYRQLQILDKKCVLKILILPLNFFQYGWGGLQWTKSWTKIFRQKDCPTAQNFVGANAFFPSKNVPPCQDASALVFLLVNRLTMMIACVWLAVKDSGASGCK